MHSPARIIDANANRGREAVRVLEDIARFLLDDAGLSERLKALRHELRAALDALPIERAALLASRDTEGDVGTSIETMSEYRRTGVRDVALAAAGRLTEALRSIEESAKLLQGPRGGSAAQLFESLRYRAYSLEKDLVLRLPDTTCPQWRLCVLVTESLCRHHSWLEVAARAIDGGADCLQLREKQLEDSVLLDRAGAMMCLARQRGVHGVVNDRPDLALLAGAHGVHVGQADLSVADVRAVAGFRLLVGVSTSTMEQARAAVGAGADVCGVGPMFATTTKHKPTLAGPEYLREYLSDEPTGSCPHLAIGGVTIENIAELVAVGCRGIAVSSAVCGAEDPASVCRQMRGVLGATSAGRKPTPPK